MKVIRVLVYEGTEEAIRDAIKKSKSLGIHQFCGYTLTMAEHLNELPVPPVAVTSDADVAKALEELQNAPCDDG